jgi:hypothetical protein
MVDKVGVNGVSMAGGAEIVIFGQAAGEISRCYSSVDYAFQQYRNPLIGLMHQIEEITKKMVFINNCSPQFKELNFNFINNAGKIPELWEYNEHLLHNIVNITALNFEYAINNFESNTVFTTLINDEHELNKFLKSESSSYDNIEQLLVHMNRDWGKQGEQLRDILYKNGIVHMLMREAVPNANYRHEILVPGAALGRLPIELAVNGYR